MKKIRMKRHESFSIREGWLTKGIKAIESNPNSFTCQESTGILGIGNNMVKSLRYWLNATSLVSECNRSIELSGFGTLVNYYDPYMEDIFTWWLIHINLILNEEDSYLYSLFFNKCMINPFSKNNIFEQLCKILDSEKVEYNEKILQDEVNMIIKTYTIDEKIDNPENNYICPLSELHLIQKIDVNLYERVKPNIKKLNYLIVYYLILKICDNREYVNIDDLLKLYNSPTKILNLDKNLLNEYLDQMKNSGLILINKTAGLNMIYFQKKLTLQEIYEEYFNGGVL